MELNLALEASAGSGKTFALSVRYCALILQGADPSRIVALTFTNKAALEMKSRVFETLLNLHKKESELNELSKLLKLPKEKLLKLRDEVIDGFWSADLSIETIDAFVWKILKKFSLHLGVMPDSSIQTQINKQLLQEEFLKESKKEGKLDELIELALVMEWRLENLFTLFEQMYERVAELDGVRFPSLAKKPSMAKMFECASKIHTYLKNKDASQSALKTFEFKNLQELMDKSFWEKESLNYWSYKKHFTPLLDEMFLNLKEAYRDYANDKEAYLLGELSEAFKRYEKVRLSLISRYNTLTFSDITNLVYKLLKNEIDRDFLYFRLDGKIEHLLIDEFQDTSVAQIEILVPIIEEIISGIGRYSNRSFFYVGDVKQSIYRFRGGQEALFYDVAKRFRVKVEALEFNYRTAIEPVEFVNRTFKDILPHYKVQKPFKNESGYVLVNCSDEALDGVIFSLRKLLNSGVKESQIAILTHVNKDANIIEEEVLKEFEGIKITTQNNLKLTDSLKVQVLISYLKYLYFNEPLDEAIIRYLTRENIVKKSSLLDKEPSKIIFEAIIELGLDAQNEEMITLIEESKKYEDIESFLFSLEEFDPLLPTKVAKGVTILTIHKSKGLEFDYVIVADRLSGENHKPNPLLFEYDGAKLTKIFFTQKRREFVDRHYFNAKEKEKDAVLQDRLNALYVAFTRGKDGLIIAKKSTKSAFDILNLEAYEAGEIKVSLGKKPEATKSIKKIAKVPPILGRQAVEKDEEKVDNFEAKNFGMMLHFALERVYEWSSEGIKRAILKAQTINPYSLDEKEWDEIEHRLNLLSQNSTFKSLMEGGEVFKEQALRFGKERKQIDSLIFKDDEAIVIDYKSGVMMESYKDQVNLYKEAISKITGKKTSGWIFYLHKDKIRVVSL